MSENFEILFPNNDFGSVWPTKPGEFEPKSIVHYMLDIEADNGAAGLELTFQAKKITQGVPGPEKITGYAAEIAKSRGGPPSQALPSPYDMEIGEQCWLLIQLNPLVKDWHFLPGGVGATTKAKENSRNCQLHHVYPDGKVKGPGEALVDDGCKVLYFGVVKRGPKSNAPSDNPPGDLFNFHVEFLQEGGKKRLKVIFDPDVKNNSENPIPPSGGN